MYSKQDTPGSDKLLRWPLRKKKTYKIHKINQMYNIYNKNTFKTLKKFFDFPFLPLRYDE